MLPLGHMGLGILMVSPVSVGLSKRWVLLGTLLPDLIDKPLYYGSNFFRLDLVHGTRTLGHTGILLFLVAAIGVIRGSAPWVAVSLGEVSHLILDVLGDSIELFDQSATVRAILFPWVGVGFNPVQPVSVASHLQLSLRTYYVWSSEILGVAMLGVGWFFLRRRRRKP